MNFFLNFIKEHKKGSRVGLYCVCSAHPLVIEASLRHAKSSGVKILIEATSNQVNQDGGYTGMMPAEFCQNVYDIADEIDFAHGDILFGGDHLGPNCWTDLNAAEAMEKSKVLIDQYIRAGFRKIHLDCSMSCNGDPVPLNDEIIAGRAAVLCGVAEHAWQDVGGETPVYIVGTEVPVPGGAKEALDALELTTPDAAMLTIEAHKKSFLEYGLDDAWSRVIGLVVQPGVEFDHDKVIDYKPDAAQNLSCFIEGISDMVYEAHSTDYQTAANLSALVKDHFAILKVGPGLTFALREALWALDHIEQEWIGDKASNLKNVVLSAMKDNPKYWESYYEGEEIEHDFSYSLSDRIRYYWPEKSVETALNKMLQNLDDNPPPLTLISQYMPQQYQAIRQGLIKRDVKSLIIHHITLVLKDYSDACTGEKQ